MLNNELRIRHFTPMAKQLLNVIETDVGRPLTDIRPNIDIPNFPGIINEVIDTVTPKSVEATDEAGHWYSVRIRPYKTSDNRIAGAVLVLFDITDIKQDPTQAQRLATVVRDSNDAIVLYDLDGNILAWNHGAETMYGYSEQETRAMTLWDLIPHEARPDTLDLITRLSRGESVPSLETRRSTKDGRIVDVWLTATVIRDPAGEIATIATTERDITEIKHNLQKAQRLAAVVRDSNDAFIAHDLDGRIRAWNPRAQEAYGYTENEALELSIFELVPPEDADRYRAFVEQIKAGKRPAPFQTRRVGKDNRIINVSVNPSPLVDNGEIIGLSTTEHEIES